MNESGRGPLEGIRVLDVTLLGVGPWAGMLLGSLGAEVLHVERPDLDWRQLGGGVPPTIDGTSIGYIAWNMNKRGVSVDLKDEDDHRFAYELIKTCDVFLCNMRPAAVERLGLGYEKLRGLNPQLVYCVANGYGETGPRGQDRAADNIIQALTGFWSTQGARGEPGEQHRHYTQIDFTTGNFLAQAVLLGLYARKRTGEGQFIEVTMLDACATLQAPRLAEHFAGMPHEPQASSAFATAPDRAFLCEDKRWYGVSVSSEREWAGFCDAIGEAELAADPRFATNLDRVKNRQTLEAMLVEVFAAKPRDYWELRLTKARVPCGAPMRWDELRHHAQVLENEYVVPVETDAWGKVWTGGPPWRFSRTPARMVSAPIPGMDTFALKDEVSASAVAADPVKVGEE